MAPDAPISFRMLGPLEVVVGDRPVALGGARQRAVLAILLIHRGEAVSVDRLADELWGESPPETAIKTVQVYVSRLRKLLGEGVLVTRAGGYALELPPGAVDADRFARLTADGRAALERGDARDAAEALRAALDLWRGPALADVAYESFAQNEIGRLEELRLAALESRIDADLALGRHATLVPELEALVREHPVRERLRGQLMLALYRSGRQTDALESYREAQQAFVELGIEPGPELRRLEQAILDHDPALEASRPAGTVTRLRERRRGGALLLLGGGLLLLAAIAAIVAVADGGDPEAEPVAPNSLAVIDPESDELVATVPTGVRPTDVSADADSVWVANHGDDTATQIDPATRRVLGTASPGISVAGLAAGAGAVWVGDGRRDELVRIDPAFRTAEDSIRLARAPELFATSTTNPVAVGEGAVWVGRAYGGIAKVDPRRDEDVARITLGNDPIAIAVGLGGVWVTDEVDNTLARIDPESANAVTATTPVGQGPTAVAAGEGAVWVANTQEDTVSRVDPRTAAVTTTIPVGRRPTGIAAAGGAVWVANSLDGTVSRIDPELNRVEATVSVGEAPQGVTVAHDLVWVSVQARAAAPVSGRPSSDGDLAEVLIASDPGPTDPALDLDWQRLFATCALLYNYPDRPFPDGARLAAEVASGEPTVSSDGRTYTFRLRPDFRFSPPSNAPVTADAFARAIERVLHPDTGSFAAELMGDIVGAEAYITGRSERLEGVRVREDALVIELTRPAPDLLARLAAPYFCAVPPDTPISSKGVDALPSAGPYYVASHVPNRSLVLRRNPNYSGSRPRGLEEIRYEIGVPPDRQIEDVEAGRADYAIGDPLGVSALPVTGLARRYGPDSEAARAGRQQLFTQPTLSTYFFMLNGRRGPFTDARLRRAVNYALDRRALAKQTGVGQLGRPTDQFIPPGTPGFEDATIYPLGGPDLASARRLAGPGGERALLYTCNTPECTSNAEILRSNLSAIGIDLDVRQFPLGALFSRIGRPGEPWDIAYANWFADYADPSNFTNELFGADGQWGVLYDDPRMEARLAAAARLNGDARLTGYAEVDRYLAQRAVPAAPFASGTVTHFLSARMGCQVPHPIYGLDLAALCVRDDEDE
jgi:YVTN family beta-propeller protein